MGMQEGRHRKCRRPLGVNTLRMSESESRVVTIVPVGPYALPGPHPPCSSSKLGFEEWRDRVVVVFFKGGMLILPFLAVIISHTIIRFL